MNPAIIVDFETCMKKTFKELNTLEDFEKFKQIQQVTFPIEISCMFLDDMFNPSYKKLFSTKIKLPYSFEYLNNAQIQTLKFNGIETQAHLNAHNENARSVQHVSTRLYELCLKLFNTNKITIIGKNNNNYDNFIFSKYFNQIEVLQSFDIQQFFYQCSKKFYFLSYDEYNTDFTIMKTNSYTKQEYQTFKPHLHKLHTFYKNKNKNNSNFTQNLTFHLAKDDVLATSEIYFYWLNNYSSIIHHYLELNLPIYHYNYDLYTFEPVTNLTPKHIELTPS